MKKVLFAIVFLTLQHIIIGQDRITIGLLPFSYNSQLNYNDVYTVQEVVLNSFVQTGKFNIVDRNNWQGLQAEKELQSTQDFINNKAIQKGMSLGAKYLIAGHFSSITATPMYLIDYITNYQYNYTLIKLSLQLKIVNVETTQIVASEMIDVYGGDPYQESTPELAYGRAIANIQPNIQTFIRKNFGKSMFLIVNADKIDKKGKLINVLINGGMGDGLRIGHRLSVIELVTVNVDGRNIQRSKKIGELKITLIEDENFSIGEITKGDDEIKQNLLYEIKTFAVLKE